MQAGVQKHSKFSALVLLQKFIHCINKEKLISCTYYRFIGGFTRKMITYNQKSNIGYDLDVNIYLNDKDVYFKAKERKII